MNRDPDPALEVLRAVWSAGGQSREELDEAFGTARSCKSMANVGFDALADQDGTADIRAAWRSTLQREGKLSEQAGSIRDLVLGSAQARG